MRAWGGWILSALLLGKHWWWEFVRTLFYEEGSHKVKAVFSWDWIADYGVGALLLLGVIFLWWPHIKARVPFLGPRFMPLPEAAQQLYQKTIDRMHGILARTIGKTPEGILDACAIPIKFRIPLYGRRPLGQLQRIPQEELENSFVVRGASILSKNVAGTMPVYSDLCVRNVEFKKMLKKFDGNIEGIL
jgi:hypothetical protein